MASRSMSNMEVTAALVAMGIVILVTTLIVGHEPVDVEPTSRKNNWLVVQYAQDGSVIDTWELFLGVGRTRSGTIHFTDNDGNVVQLSGHYAYVEVNGDWEAARRRYLQVDSVEED